MTPEAIKAWSDHCARIAEIGAIAAWRARENPSLVPAGWILVDRWGFWMSPEIASRLGWKARSRMVPQQASGSIYAL